MKSKIDFQARLDQLTNLVEELRNELYGSAAMTRGTTSDFPPELQAACDDVDVAERLYNEAIAKREKALAGVSPGAYMHRGRLIRVVDRNGTRFLRTKGNQA